MTQLAAFARIHLLAIAVALLCSASSFGCTRSATLPPLVEDESAPKIPGKFVWHNLVTNDGAAARTFYGELFGWEFDVKKDGRYSVITYQGHNLGGILDASNEENPPKTGRWLSAISVPDLDESLVGAWQSRRQAGRRSDQRGRGGPRGHHRGRGWRAPSSPRLGGR